MKNKIFVACDTNKVKTVKKIINLTKTRKIKTVAFAISEPYSE